MHASFGGYMQDFCWVIYLPRGRLISHPVTCMSSGDNQCLVFSLPLAVQERF